MPNIYLSVLYQNIIQVENKNVGLKVEGHKHTIAPPPPPPVKKVGGACPPCPPASYASDRYIGPIGGSGFNQIVQILTVDISGL